MKIKLENYYQNVKGVRLAPGTHEVENQLANYLIANGHAVAVETVTSGHPAYSEPVTDVAEETAPDDYPSYTRAELMEMLDNEGIEYGTRDNKDTLIALLTGDDS